MVRQRRANWLVLPIELAIELQAGSAMDQSAIIFTFRAP